MENVRGRRNSGLRAGVLLEGLFRNGCARDLCQLVSLLTPSPHTTDPTFFFSSLNIRSTFTFKHTATMAGADKKRALVLIADGTEEMEAVITSMHFPSPLLAFK